MKLFIFLSILLVVYNQSIFSYFFQSNPNQEKLNQQVQNTFSDLVTYSKQSQRYSQCYKEALSKLSHGCKGLKDNDEERSKLAVHFTNCHLEKSGLSPYPCTEDMSIKECTQNMVTAQIAFNSYTQFSTHVENLCYYIQSEEFNSQIENNIRELLLQSIKSTQVLSKVKEQSSEIEQSVSNSIDNQVKLIQEQDLLKNKLTTMKQEEEKHFYKLDLTFNSFHTLSNTLQSQISQLTQEQKQILLEQIQLKSITEKHYLEFEKIYKVIVDMNDYTKEISKNQKDIKEDMNSINLNQKLMNGLVQNSIEHQNELILNQQLLKKEQETLNELTKDSMMNLKDLGQSTIEKIKESLEKQAKLIQIQKESDEKFQKMKREQEENFEKAKKNLDDLLIYSQEQTKSMKEHHNQFSKSSQKLFETVNHILNLHNSLIGEFMNIENIFYYIACIFLSYILTTTHFTYQARLYLYLALTLNFLVERCIVQYSLGSVVTEIIHDRISLCRKFFFILYLLILAFSIFLYRNYEKMNYNLLLKIVEKSDKLQEDIENIQENHFHVNLFQKKEKIKLRYIE